MNVSEEYGFKQILTALYCHVFANFNLLQQHLAFAVKFLLRFYVIISKHLLRQIINLGFHHGTHLLCFSFQREQLTRYFEGLLGKQIFEILVLPDGNIAAHQL